MSAMLREAGLLKELEAAKERIRQLEAQSVAVVGEPVAWVNEYCIDEWEHSQKDNWSGARLTAKEVPGSTVPLFRKPTHSITAAELATLRARLEQAEKDADRYRWLRTGDNDEQCIHFTNDCPAGTDTVWIHRNEKLDAIIDAAIAQGKGE